MSDGIRHFWTHIAGVKHWNADGSSRQRAIRELQPLVPLKLEEEPDNLHDPSAVRVCLQDGRQVGYLPRDLARQVTQKRHSGCWYRAVVRQAKDVSASQLGGQVSEGGRYLRVDILVAEAEDYVTDRELCDYLDSVAAKDISTEPAAEKTLRLAAPDESSDTPRGAPSRGFLGVIARCIASLWRLCCGRGGKNP